MTTFKLLFGWALVLVLATAYLYLAIVEPGTVSALSTGDQVVVASGVLGGFILWVWMLSDFFRGRQVRYRVLWGWALFLATLIAGAVYFVAVYFPQERGSSRVV